MALTRPDDVHRESGQAARAAPAFLITIDTEGDNLWATPRTITTHNAAFLPRFQTLCEKYGLKPTWLTNWEMATDAGYQDFARDVLRRKTGEVGMHLHAWNNPPIIPVSDDDYGCMPYIIDYPEPVIRQKVELLTRTLEDAFGTDVVSHRAGRWSMDEIYARALIDAGYQLDCSVTPHTSWKHHRGAPGGGGGTDYRGFSETPYFMDPRNIRQPGASPLLEVPVTVLRRPLNAAARLARRVLNTNSFGRRVAARIFPDVLWLRPNGVNHRMLPQVLRIALDQQRDYVEFMLHSSEFMPGGSPVFSTQRSVEVLYDVLTGLFSEAQRLGFVGLSMREYRQRYVAQHGESIPSPVSSPAG